MPYPQYSEVQLPIPFDILLKAIDQLPTEALLQLLHVTEAALAARAGAREVQVAQVEDEHFWESELGQYITAEADAGIAIADVRQVLSVIPGSLAAEISREREER
jgi:hypothetical protein